MIVESLWHEKFVPCDNFVACHGEGSGELKSDGAPGLSSSRSTRGSIFKANADIDIDPRVKSEGDNGARSLYAAARCSIKPARFKTASRRFSSCLVAGTIGRRCSFFGMMPRRFIMYFIGIGLVS